MSDNSTTLDKDGSAPPSGGGVEPSASDPAHEPDPGRERTGRFWSVRRLPAAILAVLTLAGVGILLYDLIAVRAGRPAMAWRRWLAGELAELRLDSVPVLVAAAVAALAGLWLLLLALTPGLRRLLPMRRRSPEVRAGLERTAAALALRDRAMDVSGVSSVRVSVGRRKVKARAQAHFRALEEVSGDLDRRLEDGIGQLGLDRGLSLSTRVRRAKKR